MSQLSDLNTSVKVAVENCNGTDASRDLAEVEIHCQEFIESLLKAKPLERLPELAQALLTLAEAVEKQGRDARDLRQLASLLQ